MSLADTSRDGRLDKSEFLRFLSLNSAHYGYQWGYASNQIHLSQLPMEFAMLFHSTACMCAYERFSGVDFGCCEGENGHVVLYESVFDENVGEPVKREADYTELFCTEAYYAYGSTFMPTREPTPEPTTASPIATMAPTTGVTTAAPVEAIVPTTMAPTKGGTTPPPTSMVVPTTMAPTKGGATAPPTSMVVPTTPAPTEGVTTASPTTSSPIAVVTSSPTMRPTIVPVTLAPTASKPVTATPTTGTPTVLPTPNPTRSPIPSVLEIGIQYGISSNCGMTAYDVMNGSYGITIKEGLVAATEVVVVDILNTTYPRDENGNQIQQTPMSPEQYFDTEWAALPPDVRNAYIVLGWDQNSWDNDIPPESNDKDWVDLTDAERDAATYLGYTEEIWCEDGCDAYMNGQAQMSPPAEEGSNATVTDEGEEPAVATVAGDVREPKTAMSAHGVRMRVEGLPGKPSNRNRNLAVMAADERYDLNSERDSRSLVYYTQSNPVVITDVEDVLNQACAPGFNCMRVKSTVYVTLEDGDDPYEVEAVIWNGVQDSLKDASFFDAIPPDTIFCPPPPTPSPITTVLTSSPTLSPVTVPTTPNPTTQSPVAATGMPTISPVAVPTTISPVSVPTTLSPTTQSPVAGTLEPTDYRWPSFSPTTEFPSPLPSVAETEIEVITGPMNVTITYDLANDCGLTAEDVMTGAGGNTLKEGLIAATTATTIGILNATYPREPTRTRRNLMVRRRQLVHLSIEGKASSVSSSSRQSRNLVYYTDRYPVTIERILDIETNCAPGNNCLLVVSKITVVLEPGDDPEEVNDAIVEGMQSSFQDGSFFSAIPPDTVICP